MKLYKPYKLLKIKILSFLMITAFGILMSYAQNENVTYHEEKVKIALRDIGNQLLLINGDSVSRVMPIKKTNDVEYKLSFQKELFIDPEVLINSTKISFNKSAILTDYITEIIDCNTSEVAYSYQIKGVDENNIIPCIGKKLPVGCYEIRVIFTANNLESSSNKKYAISLTVILFILVAGFLLSKYKSKNKALSIVPNKGMSIGNSTFYFDQQIILQGNHRIPLTSKESEILKIFGQNPNQIIKREQLTKTVWEDHGVIVGRSLDMFISKLRKKLSNDSSVKITNIHGVGYKIEV